MSRGLVAVASGDAVRFTDALRAALDGTGPAVHPVPNGASAPDLPEHVPPSIALVVGTSGSSGAPKLVALSAGALLASAAATEGALGGPGSWLLGLPAHYIAGAQVLVRGIAAGRATHTLKPGPFTAATFAAGVAALPTDDRRYTALVPTQLHRIVTALDAGDPAIRDAVRSLDAVLIGGARLEPGLAAGAAAHGIPVVSTYGASETAGGCVYDGVPLAGVRVRIADGEVQLAGPVLADGYLGDPARTASAFLTEPGVTWYRTGDGGDWDGERLTISGRLDAVIVSGGEKVALPALEALVRTLDGLAEAVVVSVPDDEWGEVPVLVTAEAPDFAAVRAAVEPALGRAAVPRRALVLTDLPLTASGKPDRVRIAALARAQHPPDPPAALRQATST